MASDPSGDGPADQGGRLRPSSGHGTTTGPELSPAGAMSLGFESPAPSPIPAGHLSQYRIIRLLGRGGMGAVYQAEDTSLSRTVALKIILPEYAARPSSRERFLREARAAAALKNDHVVTIFQVGEDRGVPFLAMEYLEGETLEARMHRGRFPLSEVVRIAKEMCAGLTAAHKVELIHRDIKPANVWLEAPAGRVKLLDFGLARVTGSHSGLTDPGRVIGTPEYMSPEQARGEELDVRSDLFSLGVILYALCTGRPPFRGNTVMAVLTSLAMESPPPIRELNPDVPEPLARIVDRLLAKDRAQRPDSAATVAAELAAMPVPLSDSLSQTAVPAAGKTVVVPPTPPPGSSERAVRRRALPIALGAAAVILLLAGLGFWAFRDRGNGTAGIPPAPPAPPTPIALQGPPIRIGILHSKTGVMSGSERAIFDAAQLAIDDLNAGEGVLGRPVEGVVANGDSNEIVFAQRAEDLITKEKVRAIFGCWTSASRKAVLPVVEQHRHLLVYPVQYEGIEQSEHVIYLGPTPNQQIQPALSYMIGFQNSRRWFLVGSDYVFPHAANQVVRDEAKDRGVSIVGEEYFHLMGDNEKIKVVIDKIQAEKPDLIVNTINGDMNRTFYRALRDAGIMAGDKPVPVLSFSIALEDLNAIGPALTRGDYVAGSYLESLDSPTNRKFVERYKARFGASQPVSDPMQAAYAGIHLWAQAVRSARTDDPRAVRQAMRGQSFEAPQGTMTIHPATGHTIQFAHVGKINDAGVPIKAYTSPDRIVPEPYPSSRKVAEWDAFLYVLHTKWGGRWSAPPK